MGSVQQQQEQEQVNQNDSKADKPGDGITMPDSGALLEFRNPQTQEFLGKFFLKDGLLCFEGDRLDEAAKLFVDLVLKLANQNKTA